MTLHQSRRFHVGPWAIPLSYAVVAIVAGLVFPRIENHFFPSFAASISVEAAIAIYSSIASGMMALTGIVFSLTFVVVQFSASAYSPRLVLWISKDRLLAHALGVFSATFLYAIAALAWLNRSGSLRVPFMSAWIVVGLLLASVGVFVALIHRIGLLQVNRMLAFTGNQGRKVIRTLYAPLDVSSIGSNSADNVRSLPVRSLIHRGQPKSLQSVDISSMVKIAKECDGCIEVVAAVGDTVLDSMPLLHLCGARRPVAERLLRKTLELGDERTFEQDPKYAIRLLVDIAIKALSPAINDPTTAVQALEQIADLLLLLGRKRLEIGTFRDENHRVRVVIPFPSWDDFLHLAFEEILSCGATSIQIMRRMRAVIADLTSVLPSERHVALEYWKHRLEASISRSFTDAEGRLAASVEDRQGLGFTRRAK